MRIKGYLNVNDLRKIWKEEFLPSIKRELRSELEALRTSIKTLTARVDGIEKSQSINLSQVIANNSLAVSMTSSERTIEYRSDDVIKDEICAIMGFVKKILKEQRPRRLLAKN